MAFVLIIEQDPVLMRRITWILLDAGHTVAALPTPDEAPAVVRASSPDVVLFNTSLPSPEKADEVERLRALGPPVIDLHQHSHGRRHPTGVEADGYLHKPFDADDLLALIDQLGESQKQA